MIPPSNRLTELLPFLVSLLLGFFVGLERERARKPGSAMGLRTFTLLALLGSVAGWLAETWVALAFLLALFAFSLVLISYFRESRPGRRADRGLTTEVAAGLVFALGYASHRDPGLAALLGCVAALLLFWKAPLHRFTARVHPRELEAALLLLLLGISVLSLLEDKAIDPWGLLNPRKLGLVVLLVGGIEFGSYLAVKLFSPRNGSLVVGFCAGLISSTALTATAAGLSRKKPHAWRQLSAMVITGKIASLLELLVIVAFASPSLAPSMAALVLAPCAAAVAVVFWLQRSSAPGEEDALTPTRSPLNLKSVLRLSVFLSSLLALVALAQRYAGDLGRNAVVTLAGCFELHGVSLATATLHDNHQLETQAALFSLKLAILGDLGAKSALYLFLARHRRALLVPATLCAMGAIALAAGWAI